VWEKFPNETLGKIIKLKVTSQRSDLSNFKMRCSTAALRWRK